MKALVLGASGMLGHQVFRVFRTRFDTTGVFRGPPERLASHPAFAGARMVGDVNVLHRGAVEAVIKDCRPDVVINCVGLIKQVPDAENERLAIALNGQLPHELAVLGERFGFRLIHISTDCVFSGRRGRYTEADDPDPEDVYGRTKHMGEVCQAACLTLRTSLIGPEIERRASLLEWFLSRAGRTVQGFAYAIFSGLTTPVLARELARIVEQFRNLSGLYHVAAEPISKYDLLALIREAFGIEVVIEQDTTFRCDRSLDDTQYRHLTGFAPPTWPEMVRELAREYRDATERLP
jgi:dTDP-4-dehydrorhamnose reductase